MEQLKKSNKQCDKASKQILLKINEKTTVLYNKIIANHFNDFFTSIAAKLVNKILTAKSTFPSYLTKTNRNSFINPTTSEEIEDIKSSSQTNKATCPSSIPIKMLKYLTKTISKPVRDLVKLSFNS